MLMSVGRVQIMVSALILKHNLSVTLFSQFAESQILQLLNISESVMEIRYLVKSNLGLRCIVINFQIKCEIVYSLFLDYLKMWQI